MSQSENKVYAMSGNSGAVSGSLTNASFSTPAAIGLSGTGTLAVGTGVGQICTLTTSLSTPACTSQGTANYIAALSYNTSLSTVGYSGTIPFIVGNTAAYSASPGSSTLILPVSATGSSAGLVFDSAGKAFILDGNVVSEYNGMTSVSPSVGYGTLSTPKGIAVDESGNIWTSNSGDNSLSIFIGLAAPTLGPIAANLH